MTQANEKIIWPESLIAGADLRTKYGYGMKLSGARGVAIMAADTDVPCGVLMNEPNSGEEALICVMGRVPVKLSATLAVGEPIYFHSDGTAKKWTPASDITKYCAGYITVGGASGEMGEAMIQCANPVKGAAST